jgi:MerR family transcriptional regulator, light-induced transcriptional regulator
VAALQRLRHLIDTGMPTGSAAALATTAAPVWGSRAGPGASGLEKQAHQFAVAVEALQGAAAAAAATKIVDRIGVVAAWTQIFMPHLQAAGEHWESTGDGVEREHIGAAAIRAALSRYTARRADSSARPQLLAAATPGEGHTLALDALAAALAEQGVGSVVLEALPPRALYSAIDDLRPRALVVWARTRDASDDALLGSLVNRVPFVAAAGLGWQDHRLPRSVVHLVDLPTAIDTVLAWTT